MHHHGRMLFGVAALALGLAACESEEVFVATLSGANEVPAVTSNATGTATFTLIDNTTLTFDVSVADIDSVTVAHIHAAEAGVNGGVIVNLFTGQAAKGLDFSGSLASGTITSATGMSFDSLMTRMRNGTLYANVHTRVNVGGEIRGQIEVKQ